MLISFFIISCAIFSSINCEEEIFKQNIGENINIDLPEGGYKSVKLKCGSNSMHVDLETEDDFSGVIYTRGSFHEKKTPCFYDPGYKRGQRSFSIRFPLDSCKTLQKGQVFSNVLVVQNDKELIMPGDAAFNLECDFRNPRNITLNANLQKHSSVVSKISVASPDVGGEKRTKRRVENNSNTVEIKIIRKDEL